jgi:Golgi complex component 7 (COG7).
MNTNDPPPPPNTDGRKSTDITVTNQDKTGTHAVPPAAVASSYRSSSNTALPELEKLISDKKEFSIATYLNYALQNLSTLSLQEKSNSDYEIPSEKMTHNKVEDDVSQRVMAELALSLQMQTQSCHDEIGRIGAELRAIVPRCSADLSRLKVGMENLKDDAKALLEAHIARRKSLAVYQGDRDDSLSGWDYEKDESKVHESGEDHHRLRERESSHHDDGRKETTARSSISSEQDLDMGGDRNDNGDNIDAADDDDNRRRSSFSFTPTTALETLSTLHALKHNLTSAKQVLVAASTYNQTLAKIPSLLNPSTIHQCVQAWMDLEHGAKALSGMPGKEQRQEEIQEIRQEILTLLKPVLLHALNKVDSRLGPLQTCVSLYQSLGEMPSLMDEYVKVRPSSVHKLWFDYRKLSVDKSSVGLNHVGDVTRDNVESIGDLEGIAQAPEEEEKDNDDVSMMHEDSNPSMNFITWLPTWYDAVLELLSEERRRAHAVFGAELAPEVMVKVLNQCFRPISSSFEKRLAALCGADAELMRSGGGQLFDAICRAYASTLQFLSVAYEQMVDFDTNTSSSMNVTTEGGAYDASSGNKTPIQLHLITLDTFAAIVSPFAAHQRNFAALESYYSGVSTRGLSTDLHKAVSGRLINSSDMQKSVEQLVSLATSIFPLVQGSSQCAVITFVMRYC